MNQKFYEISTNLKVYEDSYKDCIIAIPEIIYSQTTVNNCIGKDFLYVKQDLEFEKRKLMSRSEAKVRISMIENCYNQVGENFEVS